MRQRLLAVSVVAAILLAAACSSSSDGGGGGGTSGGDPSPPAVPVKLVFLHHSTGQNWLADDNGRLGLALRDANYFVSDTNYGWGPTLSGGGVVGDVTDIGHWWTWFRSPDAATVTAAVYAESDQHSTYSRLATDPGGENEIVLFKSCFPNSALQGAVGDPVPAIGDNPLKGMAAGGAEHTVANAKGIYIDLLEYFATRPDKLFVVVTAPPLSDVTYAANARALDEWLVHDWLAAYPGRNVAVLDFFNVLTSNGGSADTNDAGQPFGNHHRWWGGAVQHQVSGSDVLAYPTADDHPSAAGGQKASVELVPLLNVAYHRWKGI
jgi:hypothetical protein